MIQIASDDHEIISGYETSFALTAPAASPQYGGYILCVTVKCESVDKSKHLASPIAYPANWNAILFSFANYKTLTSNTIL